MIVEDGNKLVKFLQSVQKIVILGVELQKFGYFLMDLSARACGRL